MCVPGVDLLLNLAVWDQCGHRHESGDHVLVAPNDHLILKYQLTASADVIAVEYVPGDQFSLFHPANGSINRHEGTIALWNITVSGTVSIKALLQSQPVVSRTVILPVLITCRFFVLDYSGTSSNASIWCSNALFGQRMLGGWRLQENRRSMSRPPLPLLLLCSPERELHQM